ncbi:MAG: hypothetical protein WC506_05220 [Candidatus Micrarchaeia archaeon]
MIGATFSESLIINGFEVSRTVQVTEIPRVSLITGAIEVNYETNVTMTIANALDSAAFNVSILDGIYFPVDGTELGFSPAPSQVVPYLEWKTPEIAAGGNFTIVTHYNTKITGDMLAFFPAPMIKYYPDPASIPQKIIINAPGKVEPGKEITIKAIDANGKPVGGLALLIGGPDGYLSELVTGPDGTATTVIGKEGKYTIASKTAMVTGNTLITVAALEPPVTASSTADTGKPLFRLEDVLSIIGGIVLVSVVLGIIFFIAKRSGNGASKEEESQEPQEIVIDEGKMFGSGKGPEAFSGSENTTVVEESTPQQVSEEATKKMIEERLRKKGPDMAPIRPGEAEEAEPEEDGEEQPQKEEYDEDEAGGEEGEEGPEEPEEIEEEAPETPVEEEQAPRQARKSAPAKKHAAAKFQPKSRKEALQRAVKRLEELKAKRKRSR